MGTELKLPPDVVDFLVAGKQLEYNPADCEPGEVKLKKLEELTLSEVYIGPEMNGDPHCGEFGNYIVPAVSLTGECEAYEPEFILLWLPTEQLFGTWDGDHGVLDVFRDATWQNIVAFPAQYLSAQWDANSPVSSRFEPWHSYPFHPE